MDATDLSALNLITIHRATIPALTVGTPTTGGSVTVGTHQYMTTMITPYGESFQGTPSSTVTVSSGSQTVPLTGIPIGNLNVTARNIYRTNANGTLYYLIGTLNDNVTTTFTDTYADNTLTGATLTGTTSGYALLAPSLVNAQAFSYSHPQTSITVGTATSGGALTIGPHYWSVTFVIGSSETVPGPVSNTLNVLTGSQTVPLTNIPIGPYGTTQRNIYRTNSGGTQLYYIGAILDNTGTTFTDTYADNQTTPAPTVSTAYDVIYTSNEPPLNAIDIPYIKIDVVDNVRDENFGIYRTINQVMSELPPTDSQVACYTDSNITTGTFYEVPSSGWRNFMSQLIVTTTASATTFIIYATLDNTIAASATPVVGWVNVTEAIFGVSQLIIPPNITFQDIRNWNIDINGSPSMYNRFCIVMIPGNLVTNSWSMNVIQY
jgi:hypothetical protein